MPSDLITSDDNITRCWWCVNDPQYVKYHDEEWGRPNKDDSYLFENICLEGFQAGLSWLTILRRREAFRKAFADFDFHKVARFTKRKVDSLVKNANIIRHRGKIESAINNAKRTIVLIDEFGSLNEYFQQFKPKKHPVVRSRKDIVATTAESTAMSKDMKRRGFSFLGPTTCHAFMQSMGLVNDHLVGCDFH